MVAATDTVLSRDVSVATETAETKLSWVPTAGTGPTPFNPGWSQPGVAAEVGHEVEAGLRADRDRMVPPMATRAEKLSGNSRAFA